MATTIDVGKIVNIVSFKIDQNSYNKALKSIKRMAGAWSAATSKMSGAMAQGRTMGGRGGQRAASSPFVGPQPFSPGINTRAQNKAARAQAQQMNRTQSTIQSGMIGRDASFLSSYSKQIANLNSQLRAGAITTGMYNKSLNVMAREFRRASNEGRGFNSTLHDLRGSFVALTASYTAFAGGAAVMRTGQMFQGIEASMSMTSDNAVEAGQKLEFLRNEAYRLGLDLKVAAQGFTQMNVAGKEILNNSQMQELFTGFSEYATALGVDQFRYEKGILAIGQMLNKQQIMAEELKGQ